MFCTKEETDQAAKLKNQVEAKRFYLFSYHVYHLRDSLKCCICMDLYNCPVELSNCKHIFCKGCIDSYWEYADKQEELSCPICQKLIGSSNAEHHDFFDKITTFVKYALEDINIILGSNISKLPSFSKILELWEKNKESSTIFRNLKSKTLLSSPTPDYGAVLMAKKVMARSHDKYVIPHKERSDAFDAVANSPLDNPLFKQTRRTYTNKKLDNPKGCPDKFQNCKDNRNKKDILTWLGDTRNKFDAIPTTQQQIRDEIPEFDLPSVSQKFTPQKVSQNKIQLKKTDVVPETHNAVPKNTCKAEETRRARSLECQVAPKPGLKRHSLSTCHVEREVVIEQVNSEEAATNSKKAAIVNLMEDKCLDAIDRGILSENKILSDTAELNKRSSLRSASDSSRGWNRMREIKKTIGHSRKKKKLKVISSTSSTNETKGVSKIDKTVNNRRKRGNESLSTKISEVSEVADNKSFDLNGVEAYFCDNLKKLIAPGCNEEPDCSKVNVKDDEIVASVLVEKGEEQVPIRNTLATDAHVDDNKTVEEEVASEDVIPNSNIDEKVQTSPLNELYTNMLMIHGTESSPLKETHDLQSKAESCDDDDDDIFTMVTQEILVGKNRLLVVRNILDKDEDAAVVYDKLRNFFMHDASKNFKPVGVQTDEPFLSVSTQTNLSRWKDAGIQTNSCELVTGFQISSTDMFQIPPLINGTAQTDPLICPNCKNDISKRAKNPQASHKLSLSGSFDNLKFETQDVIKGQEISGRKLVTVNETSQTLTRAMVTVENGNQGRSGSETHTEVRSLKRVRAESDTENDRSTSAKKNKYANDISVDFLSEPDAKLSQQTLSLHSKNVNCQEMQFINKDLSPDNIRVEPVPKRFKTQDIIRECEQIIKEACSTTLRIEHTQCAQEVPKALPLLDEFNRNFALDVEPQSNSVQGNKKFSESLFTSAEHLKDSELLNEEPVEISKRKVNDIINQFKELEDSFEDDYNAEVESITESMLKSDHPSQIEIPQNKKDDLETSVNGNRSTDMFDSDLEIIETTPQKTRPKASDAVSLMSQPCYNSKAKMKLSLEDEITLDMLSCFNKTFTPPPEFQDTLKNNEEKENVQFSSLSTDLLEKEFVKNRSKLEGDSFITSTPLPSTSQVLSSRSIHLSPIHPSNKQMNPILAVQNAAKLPLTISNKTPTRQRTSSYTTSTPKQKSILNYVKPGDLNSSMHDTSFSQLSQTAFERTLSLQRKPNVACTRLNKKEMSNVVSLANKKIITFTAAFSSTVSHMIVAVDKSNHLLDHTMKFVTAVAAGIWVLNIEWIEECLRQNKVVSEERYEVLDVSGVDGPRRSRLRRSRSPLLNNYVIYAAPPFTSMTQKEVENVILLLGGEVVQRPDDLLHNSGKISLIITESPHSQPDEIYETWLETLKVITVDLEWLSRSVGKFEPQSLRPFAMCYEESMSELAYPPALLEDVPYSYNTLT